MKNFLLFLIFISILTVNLSINKLDNSAPLVESVDRLSNRVNELNMTQQDMVNKVDQLKYVSSTSTKKWQCRKILDCPWSDWRYTDPEDVCVYVTSTISSPDEPPHNIKGEWCKEVTK